MCIPAKKHDGCKKKKKKRSASFKIYIKTLDTKYVPAHQHFTTKVLVKILCIGNYTKHNDSILDKCVFYFLIILHLLPSFSKLNNKFAEHLCNLIVQIIKF